MKIRTGFVSNSSSSSFIIFADELQFDEIKKEHTVYALGLYFGEGQDYFELDREMYLYLKDHRELIIVFKFYKVYKTFGESNNDADMNELEPILPLKFKVVSFNADYHPTNSVEVMKERYEK